MTYIQQFHFLRPWWWLALIPLVMIILRYRSQNISDDAWSKVCDSHLLPHLLVNQLKTQSAKWLGLLLATWVIAVFSLAGPTWRYRLQPTYQKNISRVVVMDLSDNTLATDLPPSRLMRARYKLLDLLKQNTEGQIGLIVYAGEAYTVSPLTSDAKTIASMVNNLTPAIMPVQGSNLSSGLQLAKSLFTNANASTGQVIIISSGDVDTKAKTTASALANNGYKISILGLGSSQKTPLKDQEGNFLHDEQGEIIFSHYDGNALQSIANAGGGIYVPFTNDNQDINKLLAYENTQGFKQAKKSTEATKDWQDEGHWFVFLLLPFILLGFRRCFIERIVG